MKSIAEYPLISVIMPAYNCEKYVEEAIESVLSQTYQNWELVIGDDGSTDATRQIINGYTDNRIKKSHNSSNQGNIKTRNRLFSEAQGDYLCILDADDWMDKHKLEVQLNTVLDNPALDGAVTNYYKVNPDHSREIGAKDRISFTLAKEDLVDHEKMFFPPASIFINRKVYENIGGLHLYFDRRIAEDIYWTFLIVEQYKIRYIHTPLYYYRVNSSSLTNNVQDIRKSTITELVSILLKQRLQTGKDWLSSGQTDQAEKFEKELIASAGWVSEKYRVFAARRVDFSQYNEAFLLLKHAFYSNPMNMKSFQTLFYLFKSLLKSKLKRDNF